MIREQGAPADIRNSTLRIPVKPLATERALRAFLPSVLEIQETPPSPAGRAILWVVVALFALGTVWACVGEIDIVSVARGKVIPGDRVKAIQALDIAKVEHIYVREGQRVSAGDPLIRLDATAARADSIRIGTELLAVRRQQRRHERFSEFLRSAPGLLREQATGALSEDLLPDTDIAERKLLQRQMQEYLAERSVMASRIAAKRFEKRRSEALVERYRRTLPLIDEQTRAMARLHQENLASRTQYLELEKQRIELESELRAELARVEELEALIRESESETVRVEASARKQSLEQQAQLARDISALQQELIKAQRRLQRQLLNAPVSGTVQQLQAHTIGGVVQPAQVLMHIVPEDTPPEIEALVLNRDIGFVDEGQLVQVKVDTFDFTKYGVIEGRLQQVSEDAIPTDELDLAYPVNVAIEQHWIQVGAKRVTLSPGMTVSVEIHTGKRRLIEYLMSPVLRYRDESMRER